MGLVEAVLERSVRNLQTTMHEGLAEATVAQPAGAPVAEAEVEACYETCSHADACPRRAMPASPAALNLDSALDASNAEKHQDTCAPCEAFLRDMAPALGAAVACADAA
jgi:hypothetical protein